MSTIINGATYRRGTVVTCDVEDDTPMFGQIIEIIVTPQHPCILVVKELTREHDAIGRLQHF